MRVEGICRNLKEWCQLVKLKFSVKTSVFQSNSILSDYSLVKDFVTQDYSWWGIIIFSNPGVIFSNLLRLYKGHELLEHLEWLCLPKICHMSTVYKWPSLFTRYCQCLLLAI